MLQQAAAKATDCAEGEGYTACNICGDPSAYSVCEDCAAKRDARYVFTQCFKDDLGIQNRKDINPEKRKEYSRQSRRVWKSRLIDQSLLCLSAAEKARFHSVYEGEYEKLEKNPGLANRVMHFDPVNNKFLHQETHLFEDMRRANIHRYCGTCMYFPCKKTKDKTHILGIMKCSESRQ